MVGRGSEFEYFYSMKYFLGFIIFSFFQCSLIFELDVKRKVSDPDYLLAEISCNRYGLRLPVIEEIIWADTFGGLEALRSRKDLKENDSILSSNREGVLDFHLIYLLNTRETYIFNNTIPVGNGFCIPKHKTLPYYYGIYSNKLIDTFAEQFKETKFMYLGEGTYLQAQLWCKKVSHTTRRKLLEYSEVQEFRNSKTFQYILILNKEVFWLNNQNDTENEKGIICVYEE